MNLPVSHPIESHSGEGISKQSGTVRSKPATKIGNRSYFIMI